ncbi:MAG TPA: peptidase C39 family protein [Candidatus Limnocylindria bacterium]|nr:peptidase C39 family protein [Candidatus Limnocylindria bacterium]
MIRIALAVVVALAPAAPVPATAAVPPAKASGSSCVSSVGPGIPPPADVPSGIAGFHAHWYGQSGYPSLCAGERSTATVAFYNSGSLGWVAGRMGEVAYLGTWTPEPGQDRASVLGGDGTRGSPATGWPRYDRVAVQPVPYVGPGQVAWFRFTVQAPLVPGTYRLAIRPLIEAAAWLEDFGVFWYVTVLRADGSVPPSGGSPAIGYAQADLAAGTHDGTRFAAAAVELASPTQSGTFTDAFGRGTRAYRAGSWTSAWQETPFGWSELIASWEADTPPGTWIEVAMQASPDGIRSTRWYVMGVWASGDADISRTSVAGQRDDGGSVSVDTFVAGAERYRSYRLRATLYRTDGYAATPRVTALGAVVADTREYAPRIPSAPGSGRGSELAVPPFSQEIHAGEYPEYDGGGEAWCSPTSTAMVLAFHGLGPSASELAGIPYADPQVDHAARYTYDHRYRGTGNWAFNTAYAARYGARGSVTRLRSLAEAEAFVVAGIPLVASVSFAPGALPGFLFGLGTEGHLLVISGFTESGDVISHDPAALSNAAVRRVYPRAAFERAWLQGSFGTVYVIRPPGAALPPRVAGFTANW